MTIKDLMMTTALSAALATPAFARSQDVGETDAQGVQVGAGELNVEQEDPDVDVEVPNPDVTVEQRVPEVTVEQGQPEVVVSVPGPNVTVEQRAPIITVEQAQPAVSVNIPEPVVTIRMPEPGVDVETGEPMVDVEMPEPVVRFVQPEPRVTIERAEPNVEISPAEPEVEVEQADAQVNVDQGGADSGQQQMDQSVADMTPTGLIGLRVMTDDETASGSIERVLIDDQDRLAVVMNAGEMVDAEEHQVAIMADRLRVDGGQDHAADLPPDETRQMPERQGGARDLQGDVRLSGQEG